MWYSQYGAIAMVEESWVYRGRERPNYLIPLEKNSWKLKRELPTQGIS